MDNYFEHLTICPRLEAANRQSWEHVTDHTANEIRNHLDMCNHFPGDRSIIMERSKFLMMKLDIYQGLEKTYLAKFFRGGLAMNEVIISTATDYGLVSGDCSLNIQVERHGSIEQKLIIKLNYYGKSSEKREFVIDSAGNFVEQLYPLLVRLWQDANMPYREISRFDDIVMRMGIAEGDDYATPHFYVVERKQYFPYSIAPPDPLREEIPYTGSAARVRRWAIQHHHELISNWQSLVAGGVLLTIAPDKLNWTEQEFMCQPGDVSQLTVADVLRTLMRKIQAPASNIKEIAARLHKTLQTSVFDDPCPRVLSESDLSEFPQLDFAFYEHTGNSLMAAGFYSLGCFTLDGYVNFSRLVPTVIRAFVRDEHIVALLYHAIHLDADGNRQTESRVIEYETWFAGGVNMQTSTADAAGKIQVPPQVRRMLMLPHVPPLDVLQVHLARLGEYQREAPTDRALPVISLADVLAFQERTRQFKIDYRKSLGGAFTPDEIRSLAYDHPFFDDNLVEEIHAEMIKLAQLSG